MMGLELILFVGAIAYALGWRPQLNQSKPAESGQNPVDILKARYASGKITREEYDQMQRDLEE